MREMRTPLTIIAVLMGLGILYGIYVTKIRKPDPAHEVATDGAWVQAMRLVEACPDRVAELALVDGIFTAESGSRACRDEVEAARAMREANPAAWQTGTRKFMRDTNLP